jgi:N-sulfoglucosamine sulfohydrolase
VNSSFIGRSMGSVGLLLFALSIAGGAEKPNVLFLLSDDHSYPYLGCYGSDVRTPNLDRLAAEGMRFDRMFVTCPQCVPSRASLMTGQSPVAVRMVRFTSALPASVEALPDLLKKAGYFTGLGGRGYHLDGPPGGTGPRAAREIAAVMEKHNLRTFKERVDYVGQQGPGDFAKIFEGFLTATPKEKPWFFWLGFSDPHYVWDEDASPLGLPDAKNLRLPPHLPDLPGVRGDLARYLGEIERLDRDVQSVLNVLKSRGLADNTVVFFMGDNGMAQPHGKGYLYDPGIHVPLIVRWPGVVKPGSVTKQLVSGEDFTPTLLEIAGVTQPKPMSGVSYAKLLRGQPFEGRKHVFAERGPHGGDGMMRPDIPASNFDLARCARSERFKLIYNATPHQKVQPVDSARDPGWQAILAAHDAGKLLPEHERTYFTSPRPTFELYDLAADPGELNNVIGDPKYQEAELELKRALTEKMVLDWDFLPLPLR